MTFAYDLAGRLTLADNSRLNMTWAYDAAGRATGRGQNWTTAYVWDGAGNMTSVTYPDGSVFTYQYDALNRTSEALQGSTVLASLTYDPLGRRSLLSFNDGSTQTWGYDNADRVTSLAHAFPTTSGDVTLTYGYDEADRELTRAYSNSAYAWSPAVATTTYNPANDLNQYPQVGTYAYTYWPEGPLEESNQLEADYDEQNALMIAYVVSGGVVNPNDWEEITYDALGHLMLHKVHPEAGVAYPYWYHSTDGLRPENVLDSQYTYPTSGSPVFQGYRRYVLGPNPDERWAFLDFDPNHTTYYPHTDREGTTIALSAGGVAVQQYQYDAYGQSTNAFDEVGPGSTSYAYRYTGQRLDSGTGLYDYKARVYSQILGRFLQPDPMGTDQGPNLYGYVGNDPVSGVDPDGRFCVGNFPNAAFCSRSERYYELNASPGVSSRPNFFVGAAIVTSALADYVATTGVAGARQYLEGLSASLERENLTHLGQVSGTDLRSNDSEFISFEQGNIERSLAQLKIHNSVLYQKMITDINSNFNKVTSNVLMGTINGNLNPILQSALATTVKQLGRPFDITNRRGREKLGSNVISKSLSLTVTTGSRIPGGF